MKLTRRGVIQAAAALGAVQVLGCASSPKAGPGSASDDKDTAPGKPLNILILGGTRFLGPALVQVAQARGHTLTLFNRGKTNPGLFPDVEKLQGDRDPNKGEGLKALAGRKWDAVIDTSGYVPRLVKASAELLAPNVEQYVFISSVSVYKEMTKKDLNESDAVATLADETTEEVGEESYGPLKALCEKAAETALPGRTLNIRPGLIVGPDDGSDRFTYWPLRVAKGGEVLAPGDGEDPVQVIDARDLAAFIIRNVERRSMGIFNVTGPVQPMKMKGMLETLREATGSDARFTWVDSAFLEQHKVTAFGDMPAWVPRTGPESGVGAVSIAKATQAGLVTRSLADTVRDTLTWFHTLPADRQEKLRAGLPAEREKEVLSAWHQSKGTAKAG
ncbi:NAD-dependent epimerase/dehydratase family protein [Corallococcus exiguus]|uniref:NAD-dependent epimerase/dehydratase family protein n=1 Tax=Corallococcus TaxID=83461 RepID=UPI000EA15B48|nr:MULTISPECIES: NAD-dependent epimerase/dehydratase family protein [Corallococcus]NNC21287.1 NAD-dependent epimerase/dehydratase family protein [Corallococcus exiguus]RKH27703.1 NAD-dependent epimerase/dehydratase family protein [Corallococcus sp. CA041A]RKI10820.1 NAD-dependent epimerase/dehydratase family protein [Corallococcus sp. AB030]